MSFKISCISVALMAALITTNANTKSIEEPNLLSKPSEFELERMAPRTDLDMLSTNLAGDNISLADGALSFSVTDVSVATGFGATANVTRTYQRLSGMNDKSSSAFGDWKLDIPSIESTVLFSGLTGKNSRNSYPESACSNVLNPGPVYGSFSQYVDEHEYWNGATLTIPGGGGKLLSSANGFQTKGDVKVSCGINSNNEQYFVAKTPSGLTYEFKQRKLVEGFPLVKKSKSLSRSKLYYLVTKVSDRFGKSLTYHYNQSNLQTIKLENAQDNSQRTLVSISYDNGVINSVTANGNTWNYQYSGANNAKKLITVTLPDQRSWEYNFPSFIDYAPKIVKKFNTAEYECQFSAVYESDNSGSLRVKHPYGAVSTFNYDLTVHGRTEVPADWMQGMQTGKRLYNVNSCYAVLSVTDKIIKLNNDASYQWTYEFSNNGKHWNILPWTNNPTPLYDSLNYRHNRSFASYGSEKISNCASDNECLAVTHALTFDNKFLYDPFDLRVLKLTEPSGKITNYYTSKRWDHTENKLVATQVLDKNGNPLRTTRTNFIKGIYKGESHLNGQVSSSNTTTIAHSTYRKLETVSENNNHYFTEYSAYNNYGALLKSKSYNSFSNNMKYVQNSYQHDTTNYLLNLPTIKQISNNDSTWLPVSKNTYYSADSAYKSLPYQTKVMGKVLRTYSSYHADGNIKRIDYQGSNQYELYENYKLGKAQKVTLPCSVTNNCGTDNSSTSNTVAAILSINDDSTVASISDFKGNLTSYEYDSMGRLIKIDNSDDKWADTNIDYQHSSDNLYLQTISSGSYKKRTYLDSFLRPIHVIEEDITKPTSTKHIRQRFNHNNKVIFSSYPSISDNSAIGITSQYDALGRLIETRSSDNEIVTAYSYLANNEMTVTDPNGNVTTTAYLAYGSPSQQLPIEIRSPESVTTSMNYNDLDQLTSITQGGVTETRLYDGLGQLCKTIRPDVGMTAYGYDAQRRPIWQYNGASTNTSSCTVSATDKSKAVNFHYDNQGKIWKQLYNDNTPDKIYNYDDGGLVKTLQAGNVTWHYNYDSKGNAIKEQLNVDNKSFEILWGYNELGHVTNVKYPSARVVSFLPNALGQPTKAGQFARDISYSAGGQLTKMTLGNGIVKNITLDTHQRPVTIRDNLGSNNILHYGIGYDENSNLARQTDYIDSHKTIDALNYDGLNRLTSANGSWGNANFHYDDLGNITQKVLGNKTLNYHYNNNRLTSVSGYVSQSFNYDDRGNITQSAQKSLTFNRLNQVTNIDSNQYSYDGYDRRVKSITAAGTDYSVYSRNGQLLYQINIDDNKITDHIYVAGKLIAKATNGLSMPTISATTPAAGNGDITLSWNAIPTATSYKLDVKNSNGTWSNIYTGANLTFSTTKTATGSYQFRVKACKGANCSSYANSEVDVLFKPAILSSVSVPTATSINGQISVSWSVATHATSYKLYQQIGSSSWSHIKTLTTRSHAVTGLANGSYRFSVAACNAAGCSDKKVSSSVNVLHPPSIPNSISSPTGTNKNGAYSVNWASSSTATGYMLQQSVNGGGWTTVSSNNTTNKGFSGKGNATYRYAVRACNSSGCSGYRYSSTFTVLHPPGAPSSVNTPTGTNSNGVFNVSWTASNTATSYTLRQSVNGGGWTTVSSSNATNKGFSGKGNATYRYAVSACNSSGCSGYRYSSTFTVLHPPGTPSSLSLPNSDYDGSFSMNWAASATTTRYELRERVNSGGWVTLGTNYTSTSYTRSGRGSATYQYAVRACNTSGCSGFRYSGVLINTLMPSSMSVQGVDHDGRYSLSWGNVSTRTYYKVQEKTGSGGWSNLLSSTTATTYDRQGRGSNTYQYRVAACNAYGCSGYRYSGTVVVTLPPSSISYASKNHDGNFSVSWAGVSTATSYQLQQSSSGRWADIYSGSAKSKSITGLGDGYYRYRVRSCRSGSCGAYKEGNSIRIIRPNLVIGWSPGVLISEGVSTLSWTANGADYCSATYVGSNLQATGSQVEPVFGTRNQSMTCYFGPYNITRTKKVTVKYGGKGGGFDF